MSDEPAKRRPAVKPGKAPKGKDIKAELKAAMEKPAEAPTISSAAKIRAKLDAEAEAEKKRNANFSRMTQMAVTRSQFHPNLSMGKGSNSSNGGVHPAWGIGDVAGEDEDSSDGGWSDED